MALCLCPRAPQLLRAAPVVCLLPGASSGALVQANPSTPDPFVEPLRQQEREQHEKAVDARLQQALIATVGFVTTRVLAAPRDLAAGMLTKTQ